MPQMSALSLCSSRTLKEKTTQSYTQAESCSLEKREALVIKWAMDSLRCFLLGSPFYLITDCAPLCWLHTMKGSNPQWDFVLQPYHFSGCKTKQERTMLMPTFFTRNLRQNDPPQDSISNLRVRSVRGHTLTLVERKLTSSSGLSQH